MLASRYRDRSIGLEFWNEPDGGFAGAQSAWDFASAMKAASLGFRAGAPEVPVLNGAFCTFPVSPYIAAALENGVRDQCCTGGSRMCPVGISAVCRINQRGFSGRQIAAGKQRKKVAEGKAELSCQCGKNPVARPDALLRRTVFPSLLRLPEIFQRFHIRRNGQENQATSGTENRNQTAEIALIFFERHCVPGTAEHVIGANKKKVQFRVKAQSLRNFLFHDIGTCGSANAEIMNFDRFHEFSFSVRCSQQMPLSASRVD